MTASRRHQPAASGGYVRGNPPRADLARRSLLYAVVAAFAVFAVLAQLGDGGFVSWFQLRAQARDLQGEVAALERHNAGLEARLEALEQDPEALERLAREQLGMRLPDEEVLTVLQAGGEPADKPVRAP